jgi:hypothetical protein
MTLVCWMDKMRMNHRVLSMMTLKNCSNQYVEDPMYDVDDEDGSKVLEPN